MNTLSLNPHTYRPDIDGLRALAIILVLLFHAYPQWLTSGFVGVDIFFVISGFLITSIIAKKLNHNNFSFRDFYARRIKRIFPGLILVLIFCLVVGWLTLLPHEYQQLTKETQAGSLFFANFRFYKDAGYFDVQALQKPLLHLWSLAVEEQFYILWPLLLFLAYKKRISLLAVTLLLIVISFGLNIHFIKIKPEFTYYVPQTRFWELLIGSILAFIQWPAKGYRGCEHVLTTCGLACIAYAIGSLGATTTPYPGFAALLPTLGAFLIILAGPQAWLNKKIFSHRYLVAIGLISYPLYLWHWPLLSFARILNSGLPDWKIQTFLLMLSFILAGMTYHFTEKPIRYQAKQVVIPLLIIMITIAAYSSLARREKIHTLPSRTSEGSKIAAAVDDWDFPGSQLKKFTFHDMSFYQQGIGSESILFMGDSNMQQYAPRISKILAEHPHLSKKVVFATKPGCPPISNTQSRKQPLKCMHFVESVLSYAADPQVTTVVIGAQWLGYLGDDSYAYKEGQYSYLLSQPNGIEKAYVALDMMVKELRANHKKVFIVLNIPIGPAFDPANMTQRHLSRLGNPDVINVKKKILFTDADAISMRLKSIAKKYSATILDPQDNLCVKKLCDRVTQEGNPIYKDEAHLRPFYVRSYITFLDQVMLSH